MATVRRIISVPIIFLLVFGTFIGIDSSAFAASGINDLRITASGPAQSVAQNTATYSVSVTAVGNPSGPSSPADGAVVKLQFPGGTNAKIPTDCVASGGATCPSDWTLDAANSLITGTIGSLPTNGKIDFTFSDTLPTASSASMTATITVPAGMTDPDTNTNTSTVNTAIPTGNISVIGTAAKTTDPATTFIDSVTTTGSAPWMDSTVWTVTIANNGQFDAVNVKGRFTLEPSYATATFDQNYSCIAGGSAVCPPVTISTFSYGDATFTIPKLTPRSSITLTFTSHNKTEYCDLGNIAVGLRGTVTADGYVTNNYWKNAQLNKPCLYINGVTTIAPASNPTSALADGTALQAGQPYVVTWTLTNNSGVDATSIIPNQAIYVGDPATNTVTNLNCASTGGATCPNVPPVASNGTNQVGVLGYVYYTDGVPVDMPAGSTLTFTYTVTPNLGCGTANNWTIQSYVSGNGYRLQQPVKTPRNVQAQTCGIIDMSVSAALVSDPSTPIVAGQVIKEGENVLYTVTLTNNSGVTANNVLLGSKYRDLWNWAIGVDGSTGAEPVCVATGGANCPTVWPSNPTTQVNSNWLPIPSDQPVEIGQMPAGSSIKVTFQLNPSSKLCNIQDLKLNNPTFTFSADAFQPLSVWYPNAAKLDAGACVTYAIDTTLAMAKDPSVVLNPNSILGYGTDLTSTITYTNTSNLTATNPTLDAVVLDWFDVASWRGPITCQAKGGATCPDVSQLSLPADGIPLGQYRIIQSLENSGGLPVPDMPAGSSLSFTFGFTWQPNSTQSLTDFVISSTANADSMAQSAQGTAQFQNINFDLVSTLGILNADGTPAPNSLPANAPVVLEGTIVNGKGLAISADAVFQLPSAQNFVFDGVDKIECVPNAGGVCPTFTYDAITNQVRASFGNINAEPYKIRIHGNTGVVKAVSAAASLTANSNGIFAYAKEINADSNTASVTYGIDNVQVNFSASYVVKTIDQYGTVTAGPPVDLTLTGKVHCVAQGDFAWSIPAAKGSETTSMWTTPIWTQDTCAFQPDMNGLPAGYVWDNITVVSQGTSGGSTPLEVDKSETVRIDAVIRELPSGSVTVKYVDAEGNEIAPSVTDTAGGTIAGTPYDVTDHKVQEISFNGRDYVLSSSPVDNEIGVVIQGSTVVTYVYDLVPLPVDIQIPPGNNEAPSPVLADSELPLAKTGGTLGAALGVTLALLFAGFVGLLSKSRRREL
ncbi:hypothetical protein JOD55_000087 [Arcanobacterium pluranimalium]|uniref:MucBP domain-containing protein n=1 Tax=Arcanobacterium pluranimalium TaxID=108028 RepID=UPI00195D0620|nr:MucBP domain-containing protein [Arcanobacterium pluranimalium]MBM7824260.1 hypothetical protein [Arcanobacterium pluranimalium]